MDRRQPSQVKVMSNHYLPLGLRIVCRQANSLAGNRRDKGGMQIALTIRFPAPPLSEYSVILYIMYLELQVYWAEDEWEKKEDLGMDIKTDLGTIFINTNHIVAHHSNDEGDTMIRLVNGECFRSPVVHSEFIDLLNEMIVAVELKMTDN